MLLRHRCLRQGAARSFAEVGAASWPAVETVLARALAKAPEHRYPDVEAFAAGLLERAARDCQRHFQRHDRQRRDAGLFTQDF